MTVKKSTLKKRKPEGKVKKKKTSDNFSFTRYRHSVGIPGTMPIPWGGHMCRIVAAV